MSASWCYFKLQLYRSLPKLLSYYHKRCQTLGVVLKCNLKNHYQYNHKMCQPLSVVLNCNLVARPRLKVWFIHNVQIIVEIDINIIKKRKFNLRLKFIFISNCLYRDGFFFEWMCQKVKQYIPPSWFYRHRNGSTFE